MTVVFQRVNGSQVFIASALLYLMVAVNWLGSTCYCLFLFICSPLVYCDSNFHMIFIQLIIYKYYQLSLMIFIRVMKFTPLHKYLYCPKLADI